MRCLLFMSLVALSAAQGSVEIQRHFEFEDVLTEDQLLQERFRWRSEASGNRTLRIEDEQGLSEVEIRLCVTPETATQNVSLYVDDIRYSNDGPPDTVSFKFDNILLATFTTYEKWRGGHEWNVFRNSGPLGPVLNLSPGEYLIQINAKTDIYGVEFDRIRINAENQHPEKRLFCGGKATFVDTSARPSI